MRHLLLSILYTCMLLACPGLLCSDDARCGSLSASLSQTPSASASDSSSALSSSGSSSLSNGSAASMALLGRDPSTVMPVKGLSSESSTQDDLGEGVGAPQPRQRRISFAPQARGRERTLSEREKRLWELKAPLRKNSSRMKELTREYNDLINTHRAADSGVRRRSVKIIKRKLQEIRRQIDRLKSEREELKKGMDAQELRIDSETIDMSVVANLELRDKLLMATRSKYLLTMHKEGLEKQLHRFEDGLKQLSPDDAIGRENYKRQIGVINKKIARNQREQDELDQREQELQEQVGGELFMSGVDARIESAEGNSFANAQAQVQEIQSVQEEIQRLKSERVRIGQDMNAVGIKQTSLREEIEVAKSKKTTGCCCHCCWYCGPCCRQSRVGPMNEEASKLEQQMQKLHEESLDCTEQIQELKNRERELIKQKGGDSDLVDQPSRSIVSIVKEKGMQRMRERRESMGSRRQLG